MWLLERRRYRHRLNTSLWQFMYTRHYGDLCTHSSGREKPPEPMCRGWNVASVNSKEHRDQPEFTEGAEISRNAVFALVQASVAITIALTQAWVLHLSVNYTSNMVFAVSLTI